MLLYLAILIILLSIILIIYNWNENKNSLYLGGSLILIAIYAMSHYFTSIAKIPFLVAIFYGHFAPLNLLAGPLIYFYIRGNIKDNYALNRSDAWHLLPFLIHFVGLIPYIISPFSEKLVFANAIVADIRELSKHEINFILPLRVNFVMRPLSLLLYASYSFFILSRFKQKNRVQLTSFGLTFRWLFSFLILTVLSGIAYLLISIGFISESYGPSVILLNGATAIMSITLLGTGIFLLIFPQILYGFPINLKRNSASTKPNKLTEELAFDVQFHELGEQIKTYFETKKPYLNPDFSLVDLAQNLDVPQHHISYCFRFIFNHGFPKMKSDYRIAYAKKLIENPENDHLSYEGIGLESGFSTRSHFYAAFQEIEGCSPGEYREKIQSL
jgi:AraC-like DNA-binding protein